MAADQLDTSFVSLWLQVNSEFVAQVTSEFEFEFIYIP
jgi:hypothetical protein